MRFSLLLSLLATACFGQTVYKNAGTKLGTAVFVDCSADAGVNCTRTAATGTVNVRCSIASATEPGCVSTSTQSFSGTKTFTAARAATYGGVDGGTYVKLEYGASLVPWGTYSSYSPPEDIATRDVINRFVGVWTGAVSIGLPGHVKIHAFTGLHTTVGTDDGGVNPVDGGAMVFTASLFVAATDGGASRNVCAFDGICNAGGGSFPIAPYDTTCGMDGGGIVDKSEMMFVIVNDVNCWLSPGVNYTVMYTGVP